jgi:hypothetical protein
MEASVTYLVLPSLYCHECCRETVLNSGPKLEPQPSCPVCPNPSNPPYLPGDKLAGTSWVKYLGCQGTRRVSRFRSSARCFSSSRRFCSVAASMSPSRRFRVTSCQRFLGTQRKGSHQWSCSGQGRAGHLGRTEWEGGGTTSTPPLSSSHSQG